MKSMTLRDILRENISQVIEGLAGSLGVPNFSLEVPEVAEHGDYATNAPLMLAKSLERKPMDIAEELAKPLADERWGVSVAAPGFLNFTFTDDVLVAALKEVLEAGDGWGTSTVGKGKTVMVEYFQLNIAKVLHIGHLRSAVIGDALKRIFLSQGYKTVSDTHIGDWGTQFGILLYAWKGLLEEEQEEIKKNPVRGLNDLYVAEGKNIEADPERRERGKGEFAKLERGDKENREIWKWMVRVSMIEFQEIMSRLWLLNFEEERPESVYENAMPSLVSRALKRGIALKKDGAVIVKKRSVGLGEAV